MSVTVAFNEELTRASLVFEHPTGNVLTSEIVACLRTAMEDLSESPHLRLVTLEGAGQDFSFGASIPEHRAEEIARVLPEMHALVLDVLSLPVPTAAIVRGRCLGGGFELALACDFIFAADTATFGLPEIALGVFPPAATVLLPRRVGAARATSAILTGQTRPAGDWWESGQLEQVVPDTKLADAVAQWFSATLACRSAESLRHAVRATRAPLVSAAAEELPVAERLYLQELMRSHDASEGVQAFLEKRAPRWKDR